MDPAPIPGQLELVTDLAQAREPRSITERPSRDLMAASRPEQPPRGFTRADLMTAGQVAELLDVPLSTVHEWGRNGTLPRVKLGRHVRFLRAQVESVILAAATGRPAT